MDGSRSHYYFINLSTQLDAQFSIQCLQGVAVLIASLADENDYDAADREKVDVDADVSCLLSVLCVSLCRCLCRRFQSPFHDRWVDG